MQKHEILAWQAEYGLREGLHNMSKMEGEGTTAWKMSEDDGVG